MRAARLLGPRDLRVVDVADPVPGPGQVLVRLRACGICASDLNAWRGVTGIDYPLPPGAPGHETWGDVLQLGDGSANLRVGQSVTGMLWNGLAELGLARAEDLVPIDRPLLGEPLGCAMNVLRRAGAADRLAFVGFGYLAALCAQLLPPGVQWIALSRRDASRALALRLGAEAAYPFDGVPAELWDSLPIVIESAGVQQTLDFATWLTAYNGRLVIAGYHADGPRTVNMQSWNWKGLDVINAHDRRPEVIVDALAEGLRIAGKRGLDLASLETHEFGLDDTVAAFRLAEDRPPGFIKAVVRLSGLMPATITLPEELARQLAVLLLGAALVAMLAKRLGVPYAVALVVGGLLVEETHLTTLPTLDPSLVLFGFLPPLLFDAAFRLDTREARVLLGPILLLAVPGTLLTVVVVGVIVCLVLHLPPAIGVLFGSLVAATDPVAVVSIFRSLNAPSRLAALVESESLINDGVAITVYATVLGLALTGTASITEIATVFGREVLGGVLIGSVLGFVFSRLTATVDDHRIEMMLSVSLAYGSYLAAQSVGASGALACVAAGLIHGSYGRRIGMSENTRRLLDDLWEFFGFVANAIVFLLIGFTASLASLAAQAWPATVAIVAVLLARILLLGTPHLVRRERYLASSAAERILLLWSGLRGALTITLALALPPEIAQRTLLITMSFGVVLFTLLAQGLTLPFLLRRLGTSHEAAR